MLGSKVAVGNFTAVIDALGSRTEYTYDAVGNAIGHAKGGDSTAFAFDVRGREIKRMHFPSGHEVTTAYTLDGKRASVITSTGIQSFAYDLHGRLFQETMVNGDYLESRYDANGNRTSLTTPFGETKYRFDALNRMDTVISPQNQVTEYRYNAVGNRDSVINANGTAVGYSYNNLNRLNQMRNWSPVDTLLSRFTYTLNAGGIRTAVAELDGSFDPAEGCLEGRFKTLIIAPLA